MPVFKTRYEHHKARTVPEGDTMTKQSHKDECDVNIIVKRYQKTGVLTHLNGQIPRYDDATPVDLHMALNIINQASAMFDEIPATIRKQFNNDPAQFIEFVNNPANADKLVELGLAEKLPQQSSTTTVAEPATTSTTEPSAPA